MSEKMLVVAIDYAKMQTVEIFGPGTIRHRANLQRP
jgi:hypothetical protein